MKTTTKHDFSVKLFKKINYQDFSACLYGAGKDHCISKGYS